MYRELMVHLNQLPWVHAELVLRTEPIFNYHLDQVAWLEVLTQPGADLERLTQILTFYARRFPDIKATAQDQPI